MAGDPTITVKITGDTAGLKRATGDASSDVEGMGKRISGFAVGAGAALTTFGINAIPALVNVGAELAALGQSTEINLAKSATVFGESNGTIRAWADDVNESLGLSDERVVGLAASMGDLLVPLGLSREAAAEMTMSSLDAAGALSAWSGGQYDAAQVSEIMTKAYLGETDGLKALGISISAAEVDERALAVARADGRDEITAQDKALATQQLIMEKSADAQAAWADGTMDATKKQNEMKAALDDAKTSIAQGLLPIVQRVTAWIVSDLIPAVRSAVATFQEWWPKIQAAIEPVLIWIQEYVGQVVELVGAAWEQFGARIMTYVEIVWSYVQEAIGNAIRAVQAVLDIVMGIISGDWSRAWEGIKDLLGAVWDQITNVVRLALRAVGLLLDIAWELIKGAIRSAWDGIIGVISGSWDRIRTTVSGGIDAIVGFVTGLPGRISGAVSTVWDGLKEGATIAKDWIRDRITDVVEFVRGIPGRVSTAVSDAFGAIPRAFKSAINGIVDAWNGLSFRIKGGPWDPLGSFGPEIPAVNFGFDTPNIPRLADGGIIRARAGGMLAVIGEGRYDEAVVPLDGRTSLGGSTTIYQNFPAGTSPSDVIKAQRDWIRTNGPIETAA